MLTPHKAVKQQPNGALQMRKKRQSIKRKCFYSVFFAEIKSHIRNLMLLFINST